MIAKTTLLAAMIAFAEARFGQEQIPISAISAVQGGNPGEAATIAGGAVSTLLGAADPCDKLRTADQIISQLGNGADALAAAIGMVTAEKNTNPFANGNAQTVCGDPTLPATEALRGITPLIDPDFTGAADVNTLSAQTAASPIANNAGLSIFDLIESQVPGVVTAAGAGAAAGNAGNAAAGANDTAQAGGNDNTDNQQPAAACPAPAATSAAAAAASSAAAPAATAAAGGNDAANAGGNVVGDADFGQCTPTIIFEAGQPGRKADEFTFQIADPLARGGQQDALNPTIITTALCNQLVNVCGANDAAIAKCKDAKAQADALTTRNKAVADTFNTAIGFPGAITNPDGGPEDVAATKAKRSMRRGYRMQA